VEDGCATVPVTLFAVELVVVIKPRCQIDFLGSVVMRLFHLPPWVRLAHAHAQIHSHPTESTLMW